MIKTQRLEQIPRLPLDGMLDLTYRCNNHCLHCWLWEPQTDEVKRQELTFEEIRQIVDEARQMGCQAWKISGGEPMLRPDFPEIFDYITRKSVHYSLNTNGTLITPEIAKLMTHRGRKMIALYGATAEVHDRVTRNPGSFEAMLRGIEYLNEAGAGYEIQVIPMRANFHQYDQMLTLAQELSPNVRIGSTWLFLSASGSERVNQSIRNQRLSSREVISIDPPDPLRDLDLKRASEITIVNDICSFTKVRDDRLFANCIQNRRDFHIDPYGKMSFCGFIKDPALRYDLKMGSFQESWDLFIPSLADVVHGRQEYQENCGSCELRGDCMICPVYAYLEHGNYSSRVDYLCQIAEESRRYKEEWRLSHLRYYKIGGITIRVSADFPFDENTFDQKFDQFQVFEAGDDLITLHHISSVPDESDLNLGKEIYNQQPWAIYQQKDAYVYMGYTPHIPDKELQLRAIFNQDHTVGTIYNPEKIRKMKGLTSLTGFASDQILIARVLADRQGFYLHASGIIFNGQGLLFIGHSGAGKSTMLKILRGEGEILCDDRMIVRKGEEGFRIHGTWSHGELPDVSPASAPLRGIFYLEQAQENAIIPIDNFQERLSNVLSFIIKPLQTADWWEKIVDTAVLVAAEVPAYHLKFDLSWDIKDLLKQL